MMPFAIDADLHAVMDQAVAMHALPDTGFVEQIHGDLLDDAGTDAAKHIVRSLPLQDHIRDAMAMQKLPEQQACRARSDDGDLRSHSLKHLPQVGFAVRSRSPAAIMIDDRL